MAGVHGTNQFQMPSSQGDGRGSAADCLGIALQLISVDKVHGKLLLNEGALAQLEASLRASGVEKVAVVSAVGASRVGKSLLMNLFVRFLRGDTCSGSADACDADEYSAQDNSVRRWASGPGRLEGAFRSGDGEVQGFRFEGGADPCTQGIWAWSHPFVRSIGGDQVAVLLMDTQGAWDAVATREQSAAIVGLATAVSSRQIFNVNKQIQEDSVESLAVFMRFAQGVLKQARATPDAELDGTVRPAARPFQALDFLVHDWAHFRSDWPLDQCKEQMARHLAQHVTSNPKADSGAKVLTETFRRISCWCLPHPGLAITRKTWAGTVSDFDADFVRFLDAYMQELFNDGGVDARGTLGLELGVDSFGPVFRSYAHAFRDASLVPVTFVQAVTTSATLLAKEAAIRRYCDDAGALLRDVPMEPHAFAEELARIMREISDEFSRNMTFGGRASIASAWSETEAQLLTQGRRFAKENERKLRSVPTPALRAAQLGCVLLLFWAALGVIGAMLALFDDWWSEQCARVSALAKYGVFVAFLLPARHVYLVYQKSGPARSLEAVGEIAMTAMTVGAGGVSGAGLCRLVSDASDSRLNGVTSGCSAFLRRTKSDVTGTLRRFGGSGAGAAPWLRAYARRLEAKPQAHIAVPVTFATLGVITGWAGVQLLLGPASRVWPTGRCIFSRSPARSGGFATRLALRCLDVVVDGPFGVCEALAQIDPADAVEALQPSVERLAAGRVLGGWFWVIPARALLHTRLASLLARFQDTAGLCQTVRRTLTEDPDFGGKLLWIVASDTMASYMVVVSVLSLTLGGIQVFTRASLPRRWPRCWVLPIGGALLGVAHWAALELVLAPWAFVRPRLSDRWRQKASWQLAELLSASVLPRLVAEVGHVQTSSGAACLAPLEGLGFVTPARVVASALHELACAPEGSPHHGCVDDALGLSVTAGMALQELPFEELAAVLRQALQEDGDIVLAAWGLLGCLAGLLLEVLMWRSCPRAGVVACAAISSCVGFLLACSAGRLGC